MGGAAAEDFPHVETMGEIQKQELVSIGGSLHAPFQVHRPGYYNSILPFFARTISFYEVPIDISSIAFVKIHEADENP